MLERDVQSKSARIARNTGWWASKYVAQGRRSAPDYIFAKDGRIFFVEFKREGQKPTELQEAEHEKMRSFGITVYVCDSVVSFNAVLFHEESMLLA